MTDIEILEDAINTLGRMTIPVELAEQITIPVYNVRNNLIMLLDAIHKKLDEEPVISAPQVVEADAVPLEEDEEIPGD